MDGVLAARDPLTDQWIKKGNPGSMQSVRDFFCRTRSDVDVLWEHHSSNEPKIRNGEMNMKKMMWVLMGVLFLSIPSAGAETVTFDDLGLDPETYYNGSDGAGGFETTGVAFNNFYDDTYGPYWEGFAYSNTTDTTTPDYTNQYSAITGTGEDNSSNYGVAYVAGFYGTIPTMTFAEEVNLAEAYITNTTYAFLAMQDGNAPAKKFGGDTGNDPDYYVLTITGKDADGVVTGVMEFYLADFRFDDNAQDYIMTIGLPWT